MYKKFSIILCAMLMLCACETIDHATTVTIVTPTFSGMDSDCDGVDDSVDLCPGIDDMIDNDHDGWSDCKYPPATLVQVISGWKCSGGTKVQVCKKTPSGGYQSICTYFSTVRTHINAGSYLGPCGSKSCTSLRNKPAQTK